MLLNLGLEFEGRPHCGLDDSKNIARIVCHLLEDGCCLKVNEIFDNRSNHPKPNSCMDTGDGMHSGDFKLLHKKSPSKGVLPSAPDITKSGSPAYVKREKSVKELSERETDEEIADLLYYFQLQSS